MIYCCQEHVDAAIEDVVDETQLPPQLELLTEEEKLSTPCSYCEVQANYKVSG
ncbi:CxxH/CxxC protein, BA_5709 family [Evansella caseinilytica]|uniref:CxxH/CxxC protein, BA_5709 family n=1 Tax=Evansella caseinilytica TaxID=1503961 RepID=A0A1H3USM5_9BACI|nr:CxxH/CxxC protein [Evansella caseinilytica]SDZ65460.1 CxxH/CxxC protein, BA_5709 family [Evansella caseinilytica]